MKDLEFGEIRVYREEMLGGLSGGGRATLFKAWCDKSRVRIKGKEISEDSQSTDSSN